MLSERLKRNEQSLSLGEITRLLIVRIFQIFTCKIFAIPAWRGFCIVRRTVCSRSAENARKHCARTGNTAAVFVIRHYTVIPRGISGLVNRVNKPPNLLLHSTLLLIDLRFARPRIRSIAFRSHRECHFTRIHACTINCQFAIHR